VAWVPPGREVYPWSMAAHLAYDLDQTAAIARSLGVELDDVTFDLEELQMGLDIELEQESRDVGAGSDRVDPLVIGRLALEHLSERSDYYTRLARMQDDARGD